MGLFDRWRKRGSPPPEAQGGPDRVHPSADPVSRSGVSGHAPVAGDACAEGYRLLALGQAQAALDCFQQAIDAPHSNGVDGHVGQAEAYDALGQTQDAIDSLEVALALDETSIPALRTLARLRRECADHDESTALLERAIERQPQSSELYTELGLTLSGQGNVPAAVQAYERSVALDLSSAAPRINLGLLQLQQLGEADKAERNFRTALEMTPGHVAALGNLGLALHAQGRYDDEREVYRQGLALHPNHAELRWNLALARLSRREYEAGWIDYALRQSRSGARKTDVFVEPDWDGRAVTGGRLLVLSEQGLGDEIMFSSCIEELRRHAPRILLECDLRLATLFKRSFPAIEVVGGDRARASEWLGRYPDIAAKVLIGCLPRHFRPSLESFPRHAGYLRADRARVEHWRRRLAALGPGVAIGISWIGGALRTRRALRSLPLDRLEPVLSLPKTHIISLQYTDCQAEIEAFAGRTGIRVHHWPEAITDYDETAALVTALDQVITVTTSLVHLTGALGKPASVLVPAFAEWRYGDAGDTMPWYPSVRLYRQARAESWTAVVRRLEQDLRRAQQTEGSHA